MRPPTQLLALALATGLGACVCHPTSPSHIDDHATIADCHFEIGNVSFSRDFMPVVGPSRGPDGGSPLNGLVEMALENDGHPNRFSVTVSVYDDHDHRYAIAAVAHDADAERASHRTVVWDGLIDHDEHRRIDVRLSEGPYLPVGSHVYAVLEWTGEHGGRESLRTDRIEIVGTH